MTSNIDEKSEGKLTCTFKNDMKNLGNFDQSTFESLKICAFTGSFDPKLKIYELRIYRVVICHDNEE